MKEIPNEILLVHLKEIKRMVSEGEPNLGVCELLHLEVTSDPKYNWAHIAQVSTQVSELATDWPKHSGDYQYPVPCPEIHMEEPEPHRWAFVHLSKWWGDYGDDRLDLLDHLIAKLEQTL